MIDLRYVKKLLEMLDESSVDSMEISSDKGMRIRLAKTPVARGAVQYAAAPAPQSVAPPAGAPAAGAPAAESVAPAAAAPSNLQDVKSPMVGTFYGAPEPGAKPYVTVGSQIKKGQVLCIIEAMKIMNEIESEVSGTIVEINATDAHPVEYGQVLFRVNPNG
ncbi:MAG TPA: acetyl-CoA carboxylase biotin carboxyl carrier protein [Gemmatimonadaceae bacterium]|nr:acetyl-CoA carboxylase biotin carboxyl carrier protein [Gemmatimonadaceae bacterium]